MVIQRKPTFCPHCHSHKIIRKGTRQNQYRRIPLYRCKACHKYFSTAAISRVKYPPHLIMKALTYYNLGHSESEVSDLLAQRHRLRIPRRTISDWIQRYKKVCTFCRLRSQATKLYRPEELIQSQTLNHRQVYTFKLHRAKLELLQANLSRRAFARLREYLVSVSSDQFPHHFFQQSEEETTPMHRSSQIQLDTLPFVKTEKQNLANDLATLGLMVAHRARERHEAIQNFMLINDSTTLACEVPVYLSAENVRYFLDKGFHLAMKEEEAPITGHIDILQVRNGLIHILDYKPEARKVQPVSQLVTYALALASHTRLALKEFKCAWFDEKDYFEFFPLHAVYAKEK